ncbi:hypothetical protein OG874_37985 [Nocardia sp. NBC_00565]|uniref:hypothetical protein n=1 Tax=Nocardia sp. NBC_00565 TaxID=2975993 RepID=UPI002E815B9D|nr:hypothetical protein [Nocardia sp. NBC_00565]WUC02451.1 hypothetical protein OG874_37985 [Nocardia sp. NBC_00565]
MSAVDLLAGGVALPGTAPDAAALGAAGVAGLLVDRVVRSSRFIAAVGASGPAGMFVGLVEPPAGGVALPTAAPDAAPGADWPLPSLSSATPRGIAVVRASEFGLVPIGPFGAEPPPAAGFAEPAADRSVASSRRPAPAVLFDASAEAVDFTSLDRPEAAGVGRWPAASAGLPSAAISPVAALWLLVCAAPVDGCFAAEAGMGRVGAAAAPAPGFADALGSGAGVRFAGVPGRGVAAGRPESRAGFFSSFGSDT